MKRATKVRLYPTDEHAACLKVQFGAVRFAYNKALHISRHAYPRHVINASRNLRRKQKALCRRQRGSANRRKARLMLGAVHERVANARADVQHTLSRAMVDENQAVIVETLNAELTMTAI